MINTIKSTTAHSTNPHSLKKVCGILASAIALNLITPSTAGGPHTPLAQEHYNTLLEHSIRQIKVQNINSTIPCDTRQALINYLKQHGHLRSYTYQDWLTSLSISTDHKHELDALLQPVLKNPQQYPAIQQHLRNLITKQMRTDSYANINDSNQLKLINQLERILPHQPQSHHYYYVDPELVRLLDESNIYALIELSTPRAIIQKHTRSPLIIQDTPDNTHDPIYLENNIEKYSHTHAYQLLSNNNIGLRSSAKWTREQGNNRSSNRTSLVGINKITIDGVIALVEQVRKARGLHTKEFLTGSTEYGAHRPGIDGHEGGYKIDLGNSLLTLIILLENNINQTSTKYSIQIGDYYYVFNYHGPDRHLDIHITTVENKRKLPDVQPIPNRTPSAISPQQIKYPQDQIKKVHTNRPRYSKA